ncbi:MAG: Lrp/AsnC family transcriptional regulator [Propionivibrio sp.]
MSNVIHDDSLDSVDKEMLRLLQADGNLSSASLGERLSLSTTPCWRRRKRLEELGFIKDYQANLDRRKLGYNVIAFAFVRFGDQSGEAPERFEKLMTSLPEVLTCHEIAGEADYLLTVLASDLESYGRFIDSAVRRQPGVVSIQSSLSLREIKSATRIPI